MKRNLRSGAMFVLALLLSTLACGADAPGKPTAAAKTPASTPGVMTAPQIIQLLDQSIDWYRTLGIEQQAATEPSDMLILYDNRQTANRVIALAFEIARSNADMLAAQLAAQPAGPAGASTQSLQQLQAKYDGQQKSVQAELQADQQKLAHAPRSQAQDLKAKVAELQGEIELIAVRKSLVATFMTINADNDANNASGSSLRAQIDAMAITVPASNASAAAAVPGATPSTAATGATGPLVSAPAAAASAVPAPIGASVNRASRFGIWDLAANVFRLSEKIATIKSLDERTATLQQAFDRVRNPLIDQVKALSSRGDALATQADKADAGALNQTRDELNSLVDQFKQSSAQLIPLGKLAVLLTQYRRNLDNWRDLINGQYHDALKTLGLRLGVLLMLLALVFGGAELWRRAVNRYVQDNRRRYQLMLLRRIAMWCVVVIIVGFAFASELGSIVTFAGLITAGIAVAMQSVLVSFVGYFFLIGKYGIRVGDRVQIGDVAGEVIELGLVRLHLLELGNRGQSGPTGRVVAFANSIVFQVSSGLFKQISGVNFAWHEMTLALPAGIDYGAAKEKLLAALNAALGDSREEIVRQTKEIERTTASRSAGNGEPRVQLSYAPGGVEAHVHYPVHLRNAAEIDEKVSQQLLQALTRLSKPAHA